MADNESGSRVKWIYKTGTDLDSKLLQPPPEILDKVLSLIDGYSLLRLWKCGNKFLNYLIGEGGGCKYFGIVDHASVYCLKWPKLLYELKRLESLNITLSLSGKLGTLSDVDVESLPKSLKSLKFGFRDAEDAVCCPEALKRGVREYLDLKTLFPDLEELVLRGETNTLHDSIAEVLPLSLTQLTLGGANLKPSFIGKVPPHLCSLDLSGLKGVQTFTELPRYLTKLALPCDLTPTNVMGFPPTLLSLTLTGVVSIEDTELAFLPPHLLYLAIPKAPHLTGACLRYLPRSLEFFYTMRLTLVTTAQLRELPPNLISLNCVDLQLRTNLEENCLPPKLLRFLVLSLRDITPEELSYLPPDLRLLGMNSPRLYTMDHSRALPRNLKSFCLRQIPLATQDYAFMCLPPNLLVLDLGKGSNLSNRLITYLPRSLTHFACGSAHITEDCFSALPRALTQLNLQLVPINDPLSIGKLPRRLASLIFEKYLPGDQLPPIKCFPPLRHVKFGNPAREVEWIKTIVKRHPFYNGESDSLFQIRA